MFTKQKIAKLVAEFLGTGILALTVLSVSASNIGIGYFVAIAAGLALLLLVVALGSVSGAHLNPAVTLGLWTIRQVQTYQAVLYVAMQLLGGVAAYALFSYMTDRTWENTAEYDGRVLTAEVLGAAVFTFGVAAALFQRLQGVTRAAVIGGSFALGIMIAASASSAFLNPAVALSAQSWEWGTYVLGPVLGAVIGFNLYNILFVASENKLAKSARPVVATSPSVTKSTAVRGVPAKNGARTTAKTVVKAKKK